MLTGALAMLHPLMQGVPAGMRRPVATRIALSREHGFLYVRIPKAANSTIARTLAVHAFPLHREEILADATGDYAKGLFDGIWSSRCLTTTSLLGSYFTFSFFRNPYTRLLSAYLDKIASDNKKFDGIRSRMRTDKISFDSFVLYLERGGLHANIHWAPQTDICPIPIPQLDYVGHVERLDEGLEYVVNNIFGEDAYQGMETRDHQRRNATDKASTFYTEDLRERVHKLYQRDFQQLGYSASAWI